MATKRERENERDTKRIIFNFKGTTTARLRLTRTTMRLIKNTSFAVQNVIVYLFSFSRIILPNRRDAFSRMCSISYSNAGIFDFKFGCWYTRIHGIEARRASNVATEQRQAQGG